MRGRRSLVRYASDEFFWGRKKNINTSLAYFSLSAFEFWEKCITTLTYCIVYIQNLKIYDLFICFCCLYLFISFFPIYRSMYYLSVWRVLNVFIYSFIVLIIFIYICFAYLPMNQLKLWHILGYCNHPLLHPCRIFHWSISPPADHF